MKILAAIFVAALTRAEIIERMKSPAIVKAQGLVEVIANCPRDMREEYQSAIASFAAGQCNRLYQGNNLREIKFAEPRIKITIGETRTNDTLVASGFVRDIAGNTVMKIYLPAPAYSDIVKLRNAIARGFAAAVMDKRLDESEAEEFLRTSDPQIRIADNYETIAKWKRGEKTPQSDEECLELARRIMEPGVARERDVLHFASRLFLYPATYSNRFMGKFDKCSFSEAIDIAAFDPTVRIEAYRKAPYVVAYGGGRSPEMSQAAVLYSEFLFALASYVKSSEELREMLEKADNQLNIALEEARGKGKKATKYE